MYLKMFIGYLERFAHDLQVFHVEKEMGKGKRAIQTR